MQCDLSTVDLSRQLPATRSSTATRTLPNAVLGNGDDPSPHDTVSAEVEQNRVDPIASATPSAMDQVELTILMPCLNEAETVEGCIRQAQQFLKDQNLSGEVLIADNGSVDGSQEIAARLRARVISVPTRGYGAAIRAGSAAATSRFIAVGDADGSYDFSSLGPFLERLRGGFDLVLGNRFQGGIEPGAMPWKNRYLGNPVLTGIGRLLFGCPVGDFHCGLRAYSKQAFHRMALQTTGMELASEMPIRAGLLGMKVTEVPTNLYPDGRTRKPHLRPWRDGWRHLSYMIRAWRAISGRNKLRSRHITMALQSRHIVLAVAIAVLALSVGCGRPSTSADLGSSQSALGSSALSEVGTGLRFSANAIDLGHVSPGGMSEEILLLSNDGRVPLTVARFSTSCDCVQVKCSVLELAPAETVPVLIRFDMSKDLSFVGDLLVRVEAINGEGDALAFLNVAAHVDPIANMLKEH